MSLRPIIPFAFLVLAGCAGEPLTFEATPLAVQRFYGATFQDHPFDEGAVSVVSAEHGDLRSYALTPCQDGQRICGSGVGTLALTPDYWVVQGAYPDRVFYLSPGGDGVLKMADTFTTLAWEDAGPLPPERPE
jgi:hypothetical protein